MGCFPEEDLDEVDVVRIVRGQLCGGWIVQ